MSTNITKLMSLSLILKDDWNNFSYLPLENLIDDNKLGAIQGRRTLTQILSTSHLSDEEYSLIRSRRDQLNRRKATIKHRQKENKVNKELPRDIERLKAIKASLEREKEDLFLDIQRYQLMARIENYQFS